MTSKDKKGASNKIKLDIDQIKKDAGKIPNSTSDNLQSGIVSLNEGSLTGKELFTKDKKK